MTQFNNLTNREFRYKIFKFIIKFFIFKNCVKYTSQFYDSKYLNNVWKGYYYINPVEGSTSTTSSGIKHHEIINEMNFLHVFHIFSFTRLLLLIFNIFI